MYTSSSICLMCHLLTVNVALHLPKLASCSQIDIAIILPNGMAKSYHSIFGTCIYCGLADTSTLVVP